jgi:hypothetical protein
MISISLQPEPHNFEAEVRAPGKRFLATNPNPTNKDFKKKKDFWKFAKNDLHAAYSGICSYTCFYMMPHESSVDHFSPKVQFPHLAYEWSNFRLAGPRLNQIKGDSTDVLDPFEIRSEWFVLDFPSCLIKPGNHLSPRILRKVENTIKSLKLNDYDDFVQERCDMMFSFSKSEVSLDFLSRRYPFIATEIIRQGIESTASTIFKSLGT